MLALTPTQLPFVAAMVTADEATNFQAPDFSDFIALVPFDNQLIGLMTNLKKVFFKKAAVFRGG